MPFDSIAIWSILTAGLNNTPRKCLGFRTPAEVFRANILQRGSRKRYWIVP